MSKEKNFSIELIFDNKDSAHSFIAWWLDGGGDGGGNLNWDTCYEESTPWDKGDFSKLRIKGNAEPYGSED